MRGNLVVLALSLLIGSTVYGQTSAGGAINGVAKDEQGSPIPGVLVSAASDSAPRTVETVTDRSGYYHFANLPPGDYTIAAELSGFATFKRTPVTVRAGATIAIDIPMKVGTIGETVEVRADTPLLDTRSGSQSVNVSGELLRSVPLTERREWYGALAAAPGVVTADFSGAKLFYIRGSEPGAALIQVDGVDVTGAARPGVTYLQLNTDTIEDIQIQTGAISASSPLGNGGVINIATASGTNRPRATRPSSSNHAGGTTRTSLGGPAHWSIRHSSILQQGGLSSETISGVLSRIAMSIPRPVSAAARRNSPFSALSSRATSLSIAATKQHSGLPRSPRRARGTG